MALSTPADTKDLDHVETQASSVPTSTFTMDESRRDQHVSFKTLTLTAVRTEY